MNSIAFIAICTLLFTETISLDCGKGYYLNPPISSVPVCFKCLDLFSECTLGMVQGTKIGDPNIVGYTYAANGDLARYCPIANFYFNTYYNKNENICVIECKIGCKECYVDYDYCLRCESGYEWNKDYTCTPIKIGLQGASLALLALSLIFGLIGCIVVIRAKKN